MYMRNAFWVGRRDLSHHLKTEHYVLYKVDCFKEKKRCLFLKVNLRSDVFGFSF